MILVLVYDRSARRAQAVWPELEHHDQTLTAINCSHEDEDGHHA
eukprot:CAMPEP_0180685342 /NCGR_PEP_ID=MMETSP1037_2-20121125/72317_1 /TAXON_ID=632150 /ORGANISM="Azadinium spinosum, Strain 3D9" /LENGTH=43 /DNA_ID= /DNA_START= /DNA_END= /DNA_ORIENTATION=